MGFLNAKTAAHRPRFLQQEKRRGKNEKGLVANLCNRPVHRAGKRQLEETETLGGVFRFILCMALLYPVNIKEKSDNLLSSCEVL